jgi:hypothetical protein
MAGLGIDVVEQAQARLFGLFSSVAKIEENDVGPGEDFLEEVDSSCAIGAEGKSVAKSSGYGFP